MFFVGTVTDAENPGVATAPADYSKLSRYHFRIDEMFNGPEKTEVDLISTRGGGDCSAHFVVGTQYMIFAHQARDGGWTTSICSGNRTASDAAVYLSELRVRRKGERYASLYGVMRRIQQPYNTAKQDGYEKTLGGVHIHLTEGQRVFDSITDEDGRYFFYELPGGKYQVTADLPAGLELGQTILTKALPPVEVADEACMEHNLDALPKARIRGRVLDPNGKLLRYASVALYRPEFYGKTDGVWRWPWNESQQDNQAFEFVHVAPGDYVLVFHKEDRPDAAQPFPRTFYGDVHEFADAKRITIAESDDVVTADIHVSGGLVTRQITLNVLRNDGQPEDDISFRIRSEHGSTAYPKKTSPGVYTVEILQQGRYTIMVQDACYRLPTRAESDTVIVSGDDNDAREVTLVLPRGACPVKD